MVELQSLSDASDRVMAALVSGLEIEFGARAGRALAERFLEAEEADFHWDARLEERWLGRYLDCGGVDVEPDRVRILGRIDGCWFVAVMLVDGEGDAQAMLGKRSFGRAAQARRAFLDA